MSIVVDDAPTSEAPITETQATDVVETQEVETTPEIQEPEATEIESQIPEKYAGKSIEDVIKMHQNVELAFSRQAQEVGDQRKMIRELLNKEPQAEQTTEPAEPAASFEDTFYDNPEEAIQRAIENNPAVKEAREASLKAQQEASVAQVEAAHPDFMEVIQDTKFQQWVQDSKIRTEMFRNAHTNFDFDSANELLGTWKQLSMITKTEEVKEEQKKSREKALKKTSSESRTSGDTVGGKKVYRRADLIQLQVTDPTRYAQMSDEIDLAYMEGRVK